MSKVSKSGPKPKIHRVKCAMCHGFNLRTAREIAERKGCGYCGYRRPRKHIRWTHTRKALAEYDRLHNDREKAFDMAMSTEAVNAAFALQEKHVTAVQEAFWKDTNDRNSRDNCALVGVETIRRMMLKLPTRS